MGSVELVRNLCRVFRTFLKMFVVFRFVRWFFMLCFVVLSVRLAFVVFGLVFV